MRWLAYVRDRLQSVGLPLSAGFLIAVGSLAAFAKMAHEMLERETDLVDLLILHALHSIHHPILDRIAWNLSWIGTPGIWFVIAVIAAIQARHCRWDGLIGMLITVCGAWILNDLLKALFQRPRPTPTEDLHAQIYSFPSGHAMVSAAFYTFLIYHAWKALRGWKRLASIALMLFLIFAIGFSRIYLGVHYISDIAAGYCAGVAWAVSVIIALDHLTRYRR